MLRYAKMLSATAGWVLAITLAIQAPPGHRGAAIFVAIVAFIPTVWLIVDCAADSVCRSLAEVIVAERKHTEELVLAVAVEFAQAELPRLEDHRV